MKKENKRLELKVGTFVMVGVGLIMLAILVLGGKQSLFTPVNKHLAHFHKIDGLVTGANVGMGGLRVGTVTSISLDTQTRDIEVKFTVEKKYAEFVREDSAVEIVTQGVLGDKYLNLRAGEPTTPIIPDGGEVPMGANKDITQLFSSSEKLMLKLSDTAETLNTILSSFAKGNRADQFFQGLSATSKNLGEISTRMNKELDQVKINSTINHLNSILQKIDQGKGSLGAFINDPAMYDDAKALVGQVNRNRIMRNLIRQTIKDNKEKAVDEAEDKIK